jgi:hypothetical protein
LGKADTSSRYSASISVQLEDIEISGYVDASSPILLLLKLSLDFRNSSRMRSNAEGRGAEGRDKKPVSGPVLNFQKSGFSAFG